MRGLKKFLQKPLSPKYGLSHSFSSILPSPVSPTPSPSGTMVKEYLWWSTRMRRCTSQLLFLVTCSHLATTMTKRKRLQVREMNDNKPSSAIFKYIFSSIGKTGKKVNSIINLLVVLESCLKCSCSDLQR